MDYLVVKNFREVVRLVEEAGYSLAEPHRRFGIYTRENSFVALRKVGLLNPKAEVVKGEIDTIDFHFDGLATLRADLERVEAFTSYPSRAIKYTAAGGVLGALGSTLLGESAPPPLFWFIIGAIAGWQIRQLYYRKKTGPTGPPRDYTYGPMAIGRLEMEKAQRTQQ